MTFHTLLEKPLHTFSFTQKNVVFLDTEDTLRKAAEVFSGQSFSSAPVYDSKTKKFVGIVDSNDIVSFVLEAIFELTGKSQAGVQERLASLKELEFSAIKASTLSQRFSSQHVKNFLNHSLRNPFLSIPGTTTFGDLLKHFAAGCQRVVVLRHDSDPSLPEKDRILFYLTQSAVLKFLATQIDLFKALADEKVGSHGFGQNTVFSVKEDESALTAFGYMHEYKISGLPIVTKEGIYEASISVKDIKHGLSEFGHLTKTVREYCAFARQESLLEISPTVFCQKTDTLALVIQKLIKLPIHRIFVIDDVKHFAPVGVISYYDVISFLVEKFLL